MKRTSQTVQDWTLTRPETLLRLFGLGLVLGLVACLGVVFMRLIDLVVPDWQMHYLPYLFVLVGLESIISFYWRTRPRDLQTSLANYYFAEWVVILLAVKILAYLWHGLRTLQADFGNLVRGVFGTFFSIEFVLSVILAGLVWAITNQFASDLHELEGGEDLLQNNDDQAASNRGAIRRGLGNRILAIGLGLVAMAALADQHLPGLIQNNASSSAASEITIVLFFVLGLVLMSLVHFSALRAAWVYERIPVDPLILRRWITASFLFLGLIGLVAFLLPTDYSLGLLDTIGYLLSWVVTLLLLLAYVISIPFMALLAGLFGLLRIPAGALAPDQMPILPRLPTPPPNQTLIVDAGPGALLQSILFWSVLLGVIGYALRIYFRQNQQLVNGQGRKRGWRLVVGMLAWLRARIAHLQANTAQAVQSGWERIVQLARRGSGQENWKYTRLKSLPPQEQVRFYYLAALRRSAEIGIERQPAQTPYEFMQTVEKSLSEQADLNPPAAGEPQADQAENPGTVAVQDMAALTEAFVEARYSAAEIAPEKVAAAQSYWNRLRRWFANRAKKHPK